MNQFIVDEYQKSHFELEKLAKRFDGYYRKTIESSELKFIEDDIYMLSQVNLLNLTLSPKGNPIYLITRQEVAFIEAIDNKNDLI
ncbi:hypothetical protein [Psychrobacter fozii]|uniref:Uncharacterized protein n=1 Tax=Psychrobacter fozii TaxID=198480 RepID=A0A2V4U915_9GAMM|nr:hypothetical protein [Psychrobacter fozii]PYE36647.1 hypothetical protein DFP82_11294 [Psychrobacter fozii]